MRGGEIDGTNLLLNFQQFKGERETGDIVVDGCAGDGGCVGLPYKVVFAAGAAEGCDRGRVVHVLVD